MKSFVTFLLLVFLLPQSALASACAGYSAQAVVAIAKAREELDAVRHRETGYRDLAVALLTKLRAIEDRLISCGMSDGGENWQRASDALHKLAGSTFPLRDLIVSERFPKDTYWSASDRSLDEALQALQTKKAGTSSY